jgi:hypothetical protein
MMEPHGWRRQRHWDASDASDFEVGREWLLCADFVEEVGELAVRERIEIRRA